MDILTLLKANIRYRKGSFISVLILTFIISVCLTTIISINYNVERRSNDSLNLNQVGDLIFINWDVKCTDFMIKKAKDNADIDHINVIKTITQALEINGKQPSSSTFFMSYDQKRQSYKIYNRDELSFNDNPAELQQGEVYVPISFERLYQCKIGDKAYLTNGNRDNEFTVKGFFEEPFVGNEMIGIKLALMNQKDFDLLYAGRIQTEEERDINKDGIRGFYFINVFEKQSHSLTLSALKKSINENTGILDYAMLTISKEQTKSINLMLTQIISVIMMSFLILLFAVDMIVMGHSISTGIEMDYTNLGVLKAIGFSKSKLRNVFIFEYILAELIGATLGILGSIPAIYYLNGIFVRLTGLLSSVQPAIVVCLIILLVVLLVSALFIFAKTRAIVKISPINAITGGRDSIYYHSRLELPVEGNGLVIKLAFRQLTSNLKQYISSAVIVIILVYFLVTITLLGTSFDEKTLSEDLGVNFSDIGVGYNPQDDKNQEEITTLQENVEHDIAGFTTIEKAFKVDGRYFMVNGDDYHVSIYDDPTLIKSILKGREPLYDNEIVITEIVANELGIQIGDTVTVGYKNREAEYIISGYFQSTTDLGRATAISYQGAKKILEDYTMDYVEYVITNPEKSAETVNFLVNKYGDQIDVQDENGNADFGDTILNAMSILNVVIYIISILFTFVVITIVCGKIFLKERIDYGIYKALGFTSTTLRLQFSIRFAVVALIGSLLGVGLNICLNNIMMSSMLYEIGISNFKSNYNMVSILMPILVLTTCFFVFAYFVSGKIKRVDTKNLISE